MGWGGLHTPSLGWDGLVNWEGLHHPRLGRDRLVGRGGLVREPRCCLGGFGGLVQEEDENDFNTGTELVEGGLPDVPLAWAAGFASSPDFPACIAELLSGGGESGDALACIARLGTSLLGSIGASFPALSSRVEEPPRGCC